MTARIKDGRMMKKKKTTISIRRTIILIFGIALFLSISFYGFVVFSNWAASTKNMAEHIATDINEEIYNRVYTFMQAPYHLNEISHIFLENGMLDLSDEKQRERFFVEVLETQSDEIYSFTYGTVNGEYYGARRNENGVIEIIRNNAQTGGNSWYYSVNEDLTAGELVVQTGKFDPRTRAWYQAAVEAGGPAFSPLYKHFIMDDLTVSTAWPVYNEYGTLEGVLGVHMLLSDIGSYLKDAVDEHNGIAFIIEKESHDLIANSIGAANFTTYRDGTLVRYGLEDIDNSDIQKAYEQYKTNSVPAQIYKGENDNFFVNTKEIHMDGLDWIVISAIPESIFMTDIYSSMRWAGLIAILPLLLAVLAYNLFMTKYLKPLKSLLQVSDEFSSGDLSKRVDVVRNDEFGLISKSFNSVADKMQSLIENLETTVQERTRELHKANNTLEANKDQLQLILDTAAEAIYGVDLNGNCTFCNRSCVEMLGYRDQSELLGKNMHWQIHHSRRDGTPISIDDCKIIKSFIKGEGSHVEDEVFWRADGTSFDVEYFSYPQIKNGEITGAVVTFLDISKRKQKEAEVEYLNCYDVLTGLHNRRCFDNKRAEIDTPENLPLSVIFADINGLKMTNDIFGHGAGDALIKQSSEILKQVCRQNDVAARVGGDEFIILLPNTTEENAKEILARIKSEFAKARVEAIKCSISLGVDTKRSPDESLEEIMASAENAMYKDKTINRSSNYKDIIDTIIETLHARSPREKQHSMTVSELCSDLGTALHLSETEISKLKRAAYLHDIGKIILHEGLLDKDTLSDEEFEKIKQHSVVGYRILNLFDDTLDLAEYIYGHHERWDGTGYPRGLKGDQIPLLSRIIAVTETYDRVLNRGDLSFENQKLAAVDVIKNGAGTQFDPEIANLFVRMIENKGIRSEI
jgi:diguanylate cyclase (GGDEF)-like protein/PAS domain S-box-containing protein/putative nucleotidyltransferase with HDIG domain